MTPGEVESVVASVNNLGDPAAVQSATQAAVAAAAKAGRIAAAVGQPVAFGLDSVKDHTQELVNKQAEHLLHPEPVPSTCTCP
jgi:hypothetical protein